MGTNWGVFFFFFTVNIIWFWYGFLYHFPSSNVLLSYTAIRIYIVLCSLLKSKMRESIAVLANFSGMLLTVFMLPVKFLGYDCLAFANLSGKDLGCDNFCTQKYVWTCFCAQSGVITWPHLETLETLLYVPNVSCTWSIALISSVIS